MKKLILTLGLLIPAFAFAEESKDISKIDGQLVKVGDKTHYEYSYKKWNIGLNAFTLPLGIISPSASYAFTSNLAARVGGHFNTNTSETYHKSSVSLGLPIYFRKVYDGFFVEPGVDSNAGVYVAGGYHWMWDSGFNMHLGLGIAKKQPVGMLQVSYAFN